MRKVAASSTPLIVLCNVGQLGLLHDLYSAICIPTAVYQETTRKQGSACRALLETPEWINACEVRPPCARACSARGCMRARLR